ncbi:MAG: 30S ribosomal protein S12 methylthiotransferase RimO [Proteobacteria bacterium]|nr:MAG: 30S ribosomal protein S12 methylthiotransferase RimO [Pseudomonadota bacterium]
MTSAKASVHFRSLGCPKNRVDSEVMLGSLALSGYALAERLDDADVVVINTCSFIESARQESVDAILEVAELRETGRLRALVVAGCLPQRYGGELAKELPEVDAFVGTGEFQRIAEILDGALGGRRGGVYVEAGRTYLYGERDPRLLVGPGHSAYLKIAEGCDRVCAFCAIPGIRGRFQSRSLESLVAEARQLGAAGVRELNLVAQDSTSWGKDLPAAGAGRPRLDQLLRALDAVEELDWVRLLYVYPSAVTDELIAALAEGRRVLPYVDVPLQHASDAMLRAMKRGTTADRQQRLVERLRAAIPGVALRTTFIVGFPGETDADFDALCEFVREVRFDRVGVFRYSDEDGTAARELPGKVSQRVARERHRRMLALLRDLQAEQLAGLVGQEVDVLVDAGGRDRAVARMWSQAPDIDGNVLLRGGAATGERLRARITGVRGADLDAARADAPVRRAKSAS